MDCLGDCLIDVITKGVLIEIAGFKHSCLYEVGQVLCDLPVDLGINFPSEFIVHAVSDYIFPCASLCGLEIKPVNEKQKLPLSGSHQSPD